MQIRAYEDLPSMAAAAAADAARLIEQAVSTRGRARIVAATGASQIAFLAALAARRDLPWRQVELFHLDEYIGVSASHPASFRRYLRERFVGPTGIPVFHELDGLAEPEAVCREIGARLGEAPIDAAFVGIGENAHLAFNDPPADFDTGRPFLVVALDEACRRQQVGEGWFPDLPAVPTHAISMSCRQILAAREIVVVVPDARKAEAVRLSCEGEIGPAVPASILRTHAAATLYLDAPAASQLSVRPPIERMPSIGRALDRLHP